MEGIKPSKIYPEYEKLITLKLLFYNCFPEDVAKTLLLGSFKKADLNKMLRMWTKSANKFWPLWSPSIAEFT